MTTATNAPVRSPIGEQYLLNPDKLRSIRINIEYTNPNHQPKDLAWKEKGNMASKQNRYANKPKGIPLWKEFGGERGDLVNVSLANLVVGIVNNGLRPVKAYNEERTGRRPNEKPKFRTTFVYMFENMYKDRPEILEILPAMDALRERSIRKDRELRRESMYGHAYCYLNRVYDDVDGELVDSGHEQLDITAIYKTPLFGPDGKPILASNTAVDHYDDEMFKALGQAGVEKGQPLSPLYSIETVDSKLSLFRERVTTRPEAYALAKDLVWVVDPDSFSL